MKRLLSFLCLSAVLLFIYMPILILAVYSFTTSPQLGPIRGFSLHNYVTLFETEELRNMILGTFYLAIFSAVIATALGTLGAVGAFYSRRFSRAVIGGLNNIPVVNADVVTGFSLCIFMIALLNISKDTYIPLVTGHVVLSSPFVFMSVMPKLKQMDNSIYEAALDIGATPMVALRKVVLPQIYSGSISGFMMAVTLSLDDYFVATYTKPATFDTISTYVVNATKGAQTEVKTALWALSTVIFAAVVIVVIVMNMTGRKGRADELD